MRSNLLIGMLSLISSQAIASVEVGYSSQRSSEDISSQGKLKQEGNFLIPAPIKAGHVTKIVLEKGRVYHTPIIIKYSNTTLDCNHSIIDGRDVEDSGIIITGQLNNEKSRSIKNIQIKNCYIRNFKGAGIVIYNAMRTGNIENPYMMENNPIPNWIEQNIKDNERLNTRDSTRENSPLKVRINNVKIKNTSHGIYIGPYVKGVVISNSTITKTTIGIHISHSSRQTSIYKSNFFDNGKRGEPGSDREAIVIDGSSNNIISQNVFANNHGAGIRTYKNCGEAMAGIDKNIKNKAGKTREEGANNNLISNNVFYLTNSFYKKYKAENYKAISIAARQSRNSLGWMCSDGFYYVEYNKSEKVFGNKDLRMIIRDKNNKFHIQNLETVVGSNGKSYEASMISAVARDYSSGNKIMNNSFRNYDDGAIQIQDDNNEILNNSFSKLTSKNLIRIGSKFRGKLGDPVLGNRIYGNCANEKVLDPFLEHNSNVKNNEVVKSGCGYVDQRLQVVTQEDT